MNEKETQKFKYHDNRGGWEVVYPRAICDPVTEKKQEQKTEGIKVGAFMLFVGLIIAFFILDSIIQNAFHISSMWSAIVIIILLIIIGVYIFRFFIFKENEQYREFQEEDTDTLGRFFDLSNSKEDVKRINGKDIHSFRFDNGSYVCCIKLIHGSYDVVKRATSKEVMIKIYNILGKYNIDFSPFIGSEKFSETQDYLKYMETLNNIQHIKYQQMLNAKAKYIFKETENCYVDTTYLLLYPKDLNQRLYMYDALREIFNILNSYNTVYRDYKSLTYSEYINLCEEYHGVDVIDLSTVKSSYYNKSLIDYINKVGIVEIGFFDGTRMEYNDEVRKLKKNDKLKDL